MSYKIGKQCIYGITPAKKPDILANKFKPASYNEKDLIDFSKPNRWMSGIERHKNPSHKGFLIFLAICFAGFIYFATRWLW